MEVQDSTIAETSLGEKFVLETVIQSVSEQFHKMMCFSQDSKFTVDFLTTNIFSQCRLYLWGPCHRI